MFRSSLSIKNTPNQKKPHQKPTPKPQQKKQPSHKEGLSEISRESRGKSSASAFENHVWIFWYLLVCVCPAPLRECSHRAAVSVRKVRNNGRTWNYIGAVTKHGYHFHVPEICQPELQLGKELLPNLIQWNQILLWKLLHFRKLGERMFIICLQQLCVFPQITLAYRKWYWMCVKGKSHVSSIAV